MTAPHGPNRKGRTGRAVRILAAGSVLLVVGGLIGWSLRTLLAPPEPLEQPAPYALVSAEEGTLGRSLSLNAAVTWDSNTTLLNHASGTVTDISADVGTPMSEATVVYSVDLMPVYLARGRTPMFRDLSEGMRGEDVAQLQRFLNTHAHAQLTDDGYFGRDTTDAVKSWQQQEGSQTTGMIPSGQLLFVPTFPVRLRWSTDVGVGALVNPGDTIAAILAEEPQITVTLPEGPLSLVSEGMTVELTYQKEQWRAVIGAITAADEEHEAFTTLLPADGADSICANQCDMLPPEDTTGIPARIIVTPEERGVVVPTSAIRVSASGSTIVIDEGGQSHDVSVGVSVSGRTVISGIEAGLKVRVFADSGQSGT